MNRRTGAVRGPLADTLGQEVRGVISAYLFGSIAEGRAHRESDVDVGILLDRAVYPRAADRFDVRLRCVGLLSAAVGRESDVVILNDAPPQLARHILAADRILLNDGAVDHAFRRTTRGGGAAAGGQGGVDLDQFLVQLTESRFPWTGRRRLRAE